MWETIGYHKNKIFAIILVTGLLYLLSLEEEELEDPYALIVEYDCREVMRNKSTYPEDIISQCIELIHDLETNNAPKISK